MESSDRRDYSSYGGGGGGGHYGPGGDRNDYHSRDRHHGGHRGSRRGRGRGRGRGGYRHQPYRRHPGGGGGRRQGNRFAASAPQDPNQQLVRTLLELLNKLGVLVVAPQQEQEQQEERALVTTQTANVQSLTKLLTDPSKAHMFLKFAASSNSGDEQAGPLGAGLVHAVLVGPLQTPVYTALTLACQEQAPQEFAGVAGRCRLYAVQWLARDLDAVLLISNDTSTSDDRARAVLRLRLMLRYLALLAATGLVQATNDEDDVFVPNTSQSLTLLGLLKALVQAARQAQTVHENTYAATVLAILVLDTVPYLTNILPRERVMQKLVEPLEQLLGTSYMSTFLPGVGSTAILLKDEQLEDVGNDEEQDEDKDEDEDDDDEDASGQVCDSLQDLLRAVQHCLKDDDASSNKIPCRFALFSDQPWRGLTKEVSNDNTNEPESELPPEQQAAPVVTTAPLVYTGEPLTLPVFDTCQSLGLLIGGGGNAASDKKLAVFDLDGIVFGRLPIFGPPPEAAEDEDDEENEGMDDDEVPVNERLQAYRMTFGLVDRYFICEAVRDCLLSHESSVDDKGVERGTVKGVAEQVWSIRQMYTDKNVDGIEYCILEAILSLIVQDSSVSSFRLIYLSRVLLELMRLDANVMAPAIVVGVSNLFQDYMPTLVPTARYNLSRWFAFHMINTNYQWPVAYWKHWEPFVLYGWHNSRGAFVKGALALMVENLSNPGLLVTDCLPKESVLGDHLLESPSNDFSPLPDDSSLKTIENEVKSRIYEHSEDAEMLRAYLVGDEVSETVASSLDTLADESSKRWWRTGIVMRALLSPAQTEYARIKAAIERARAMDEDAMDEDAMDDEDNSADDVLSIILDTISRYRPLLLGAIAKDAEEGLEGKDEADVLVSGEVFLLRLLDSITGYSQSLLEGCVQSLVAHKLVTSNSVLKWSLGDDGSDGANDRVIRRWWDAATLAIRLGAAEVLIDSDSGGVGEMNVDGVKNDQSSVSKKAKALIDFLDPMLTYIVRRVCRLLDSQQGETKGNKFSPEQVDLVEGTKLVVRKTRQLAAGDTDTNVTTVTEMQDNLPQSAITGSQLASLCSGTDESPAVEWLQKSLDRM